MSDINDVMSEMVSFIANVAYPTGTANASVTGSPIKIYPGWPLPSVLDADIAAGTAHVSVFQAPHMSRNTSRYAPTQHVMSVVAATVTLTISGRTVTVGGSLPSTYTPQNVAIIANGTAYIYPVQASDTLTSIATGLASLIAQGITGTTSNGTVITVPVGTTLVARVGTTGQVSTEWEREECKVMVTVWAPDPISRGTISAAIRASFAQINFLTMPDGFAARVVFANDRLSDENQTALIYRRDLNYTVEYAITTTEQIATVVAVEASVQAYDATLQQRTY